MLKDPEDYGLFRCPDEWSLKPQMQRNYEYCFDDVSFVPFVVDQLRKNTIYLVGNGTVARCQFVPGNKIY